MSDDTKANVADATKNVSDDTKQDTKKVYDEDYVNTVKAESIERGKKLKEAEEKLKKLEDEKLSDSEKKDKKVKDLEAEIEKMKSTDKQKDIDNLILKAISGKNFIYIDAAELLIKKELASEEEITEKVVEKIVDKLIKDKPNLISTNPVNPSDGNFKKMETDLGKNPDKLMGQFLHGK